MDIASLFSKLDISTFGMVWAKLTGGWKGLAVYFCKAVTKLLKKVDAAELTKYADIIQKVLELVTVIVANYVKEPYKKAGEATTSAISSLLEHIRDGEYTEEELDSDIDAIEKCVDEWKNAGK